MTKQTGKKKSKLLSGLGLIVGMLLGGLLFGYALGHVAVIEHAVPDKETFTWPAYVALVASFFVAIGIHELGHLITGLAHGFKFQLYVVGVLGIKRDSDEHIKVYFNRDMNLFGGVAATMPTKDTTFSPEAMGKILLAGPLSSLALTAICFSIAFLTPQPTRFILLILGVMSLLIFAATTIPARTGVFYTDRKRYQRLKNGGAEQATELALIKAINAQQRGEKDVPLTLEEIMHIQQDKSPFMRYTGLYYECLYWKKHDPDRIAETRSMMDDLGVELPSTLIKMFEKEMEKDLA